MTEVPRGTAGGAQQRSRRWGALGRLVAGQRRRFGSARPAGSRSTLLALALTALTLMTLDHQSDLLDPVRTAAGEAIGPLQAGAATAARPVAAAPGWFRTRADLEGDVATLQAENADLRRRSRPAARPQPARGVRPAERAGGRDRAGASSRPGWSARGPQQSFARTITIDAGSRAGLTTDLTVVSGDGLVGRVIRVTPTTATVLLVVDADSVVGGRLGDSMELGFLRGRGVVGEERSPRPRAGRRGDPAEPR